MSAVVIATKARPERGTRGSPEEGPGSPRVLATRLGGAYGVIKRPWRPARNVWRAGEHASQGQPGFAAVRAEATLLQRHGEGARLLAARRVLEVGKAVAVVVDAVAANLGGSRFRLGAARDRGVNAYAAAAAVGGAE